MDFQRYSRLQFEARGLNSSAARDLANELEKAVIEEIHQSVLDAFLNVVKGLNEQGHNLAPYDEIRVGEIAFRDEAAKGECALRLACDVVISTGYADTWDDNDSNVPGSTL